MTDAVEVLTKMNEMITTFLEENKKTTEDKVAFGADQKDVQFVEPKENTDSIINIADRVWKKTVTNGICALSMGFDADLSLELTGFENAEKEKVLGMYRSWASKMVHTVTLEAHIIDLSNLEMESDYSANARLLMANFEELFRVNMIEVLPHDGDPVKEFKDTYQERYTKTVVGELRNLWSHEIFLKMTKISRYLAITESKEAYAIINNLMLEQYNKYSELVDQHAFDEIIATLIDFIHDVDYHYTDNMYAEAYSSMLGSLKTKIHSVILAMEQEELL